MKKLKLFWNFDHEEQWLNEMAGQGHLVNRVGLRYAFSAIEPGTAVVRVDYRPTMNSEDYADYIRLFEDAGWRHCAGSRSSGRQYFASFTTDARADIFSDTRSKAERYRRSISAHTALLLPLAVFVIIMSTNGTLLPRPQEWYLTPGLWEKEGLDFVGSFAFESLFVLFRVGGPLLILAVGIYAFAAIFYQSRLLNRAR